MLRHKSLVICSCFLAFIFSCNQEKKDVSVFSDGNSVKIEYAKGFVINDHGDFYTVVVRDPLDSNKVIMTYYLYRNGAEPRSEDENVVSIQIPINDLASLSTTHLAFFEALHVEEKLIAFSGVEYIYSDRINQLVEDKRILDIGNEGGLNEELLVSLQPDIIMAYNIGDPEYDRFDKLRTLKLNPVLNNEYLELTPLGQAEWIKFVAVFFDKLDLATSLFNEVAQEYNAIKKITDTIQNKPTVFTGLSFKGEWTIPGGKSFAAAYLQDAGAEYMWKEDERTGNFPVSFEEVINKARDADFWLHAGAAERLQDLTDADIRNNYFSANKKGLVFNNNNRLNSFGGNDYWESAVFAPNIVLKDLVKIFHPELMQEHNFVYYKKLQ